MSWQGSGRWFGSVWAVRPGLVWESHSGLMEAGWKLTERWGLNAALQPNLVTELEQVMVLGQESVFAGQIEPQPGAEQVQRQPLGFEQEQKPGCGRSLSLVMGLWRVSGQAVVQSFVFGPERMEWCGLVLGLGRVSGSEGSGRGQVLLEQH